MANAAFFAITPDEALQELNIAEVKSEGNLHELIEASTDAIEQYLGRNLVTRGTITEYHEVGGGCTDLFLRERPIIAVTSVHESSSRTYDSTTLKTEDTHFLVYTAEGMLVRMSGSSKSTWLAGGLESIKVVYTGGAATVAGVDAEIKKVCRELVASQYREITERAQNQDSVSDDFGTVRRFGPPMLTKGQKGRLYVFRNDIGAHTWTRSTAA